jgi:hypothetical protein
LETLVCAITDALKGHTIPLLLGFASAWGMFELTERRKARRAQQEIRRALRAELENAEVLVSVFVAKHARYCSNEADVAFAANEIRWFYGVGRERMVQLDVLPGAVPEPENIIALSDDQIVELYSGTQETIGTKIVLPVLEGAVSGKLSGLKSEEISALSMVRLQAYLLNQAVDLMKDAFQLTFTITDLDNHETE